MLELPLATFLAFVVTGVSILVAVVWALDDRRRDSGDD
jgi:hypothetical protein